MKVVRSATSSPRQFLQLGECSIGYSDTLCFWQIDKAIRPAAHEHDGDLLCPVVFAGVLFWGESQACDVAVDGLRAQLREIVRLLYDASRFQRRFGNSGIADSGRIVQIGVHRGEN